MRLGQEGIREHAQLVDITMAGFPYRLLVVDDDPSIRDLYQASLSMAGYEVRVAKDGLDALAQMRGALPDLILTDLKMANMSGFEFLSVVRRRFPQIPTIAISGEYEPPKHPFSLSCYPVLPAMTSKRVFTLPPRYAGTVRQKFEGRTGRHGSTVQKCSLSTNKESLFTTTIRFSANAQRSLCPLGCSSRCALVLHVPS